MGSRVIVERSSVKGPAKQKYVIPRLSLVMTFKWIVTYWRQSYYTQITKLMGPKWSPPGSCRPQMGPILVVSFISDRIQQRYGNRRKCKYQHSHDIDTLLHFAGGHQGSRKAHQADNQLAIWTTNWPHETCYQDKVNSAGVYLFDTISQGVLSAFGMYAVIDASSPWSAEWCAIVPITIDCID